MKTKLTAILLALFIAIPSARAASQNECAIWLCLPFGFSMPGCDKAFSAMIDRLREFRNAAPSFNSCSVDVDDSFTIEHSQAALMGTRIINGKFVPPERKVLPGFCNQRDSGPEEPLGCISTLNAVMLYKNGVQMGMTYYRNKQGHDYVEVPATGDIYRADLIPAEAIQQVYGGQ